ncbi:uncharacterized protein LOC127855498 isoform X2 [Dreissena polymorpha]|nr:uncharacterized protein LOC127855498 isoform X2 [Dreissena polymorpha]
MLTSGRTNYKMKRTCVVLILNHVLSCVCGRHSEQYIQSFKEVCPYNNICYENASKLNTDPDVSPCCEECSCEADCYSFQNCCPDAITFDALDQPPIIPCVPWYNVYGINVTLDDPSEQYGYRIISSCPPGNIFHKSTELCGKASRSLDIIVSDSTGRVYRNEDCALCNGVTTFTRWGIRILSCDGLFFQTFDSLEDRDNYARNHCSIVAVPPEEKVNRCVLRPYRQCAKTNDVDSDREDACIDNANNIIIYRQSTKTLIAYANADCYLCNNPLYGNSNINHLCNVKHFGGKNTGLFKNGMITTLIDYQKSVNTHQQTGDKYCKVTEVYDYMTKQCRKLICPRGSMAFDGQCVNLVKMTGMTLFFKVPSELTYVQLGILTSGDFLEFASILEEYVLTAYNISCEMCRSSRTSTGSAMMRLAVSSTCPMETLHKIAREMSTRLTYLNVTISGRLITVPVFADVAVFGPQVKPIVTGCDQVYFVAGLAFPVHECPSVQLSFADMNNAGIANAEMNKLTFSDCIGMTSNDSTLINISYFRNLTYHCPPSDLQTNASRVYKVCINSYFRLRTTSSSSKRFDLLYFSITVFVMFYLCLFI